MSFADLIPGLKGTGSRRAVDEVDRLRDDNRKLLDRQLASDDFFAQLMHDVVTTNAALQQEKQLREKDRQSREIAAAAVAQMQAARNDWRDEALRLRRELAPYKAREANANRIDVPPMHRDTSDPEDQATVPQGIDVRTLQQAAAAGLLGPIGPVLNPGRIH